MTKLTTAIFGEMPSRTDWIENLNLCGSEKQAEIKSAQDACTGEIGVLLASLVGELPGRFAERYPRFNLNAQYRPCFNLNEAAVTASRILTTHPEIGKVVCLGRKVGDICGFAPNDPWLSSYCYDRSYLLLPHPSRRNRWWNIFQNRRSAALALRKFLRE
jgi:hypothetical protein